MPHTRHPAITRGHYQFQTFIMGQVSRPGPAGDATARTTGTIPMILRVVVAGNDMRAYLPDVLDESVELTDDAIVQMVAPYLREGLLDPWDGRGRSRVMPVVTLATKEGLSFVQAVGCLN